MIASFADVVGMTVASECVLAGELGIAYATICVVDNLANGVGGAPLAVEDFEAGKSLNRRRLLAALTPIATELGDRVSDAPEPLAVTGATLAGARVGMRCRGRPDRRARPRRCRSRGRSRPRRSGDGARSGARQRAHARRDDALPRLCRRPAADGVARAAHLAGRGPARARGRLLGHEARLHRDDPHRHRRLLGHVLAAGGDSACRRRRRPAGADRSAADRRRRPRRYGEAQGGRRRRARRARGRAADDRSGLRTACDLHRLRAVAGVARRALGGDGHPDPHPPLRDQGRGRRMRRRARPAPGRVPRPARRARAADPARALGLARRRASAS